MKAGLSATVNEQDYWQHWHRQPSAFSQPTLDVIQERLGLADARWERSPQGKNVLFFADDVVVKLCPPFWTEDMRGEEAALRFVARRLPVRTPDIVVTSQIEGWHYLVLPRLPGVSLRSVWDELPRDDRIAIARQHGEITAAIHALPIDHAPARLTFDWSAMLREQRVAYIDDLRCGGVPDPLSMTHAVTLIPQSRCSSQTQ